MPTLAIFQLYRDVVTMTNNFQIW